MLNTTTFHESVEMKFQIYNGLLLNLPFKEIKNVAAFLPVFNDYCRENLEKEKSPLELVENFFKERLNISDFTSLTDELFKLLRLVERQIVLFDALEDAAYSKIHDLHASGSLKDILNQIERNEYVSNLQHFLKDYKVRIVLTAHPTQFYTDQVLGILANLAESIEKSDLKEINNRLLQLGKTRFKKHTKPTPMDEAESMLSILENVLYPVLPDVHCKLAQEVYGNDIKGLMLNGIVELGFWPGGDRDGNPFVNSATTLNVASMLKKSILKLYWKDIQKLKSRLTFDNVSDKINHLETQIAKTLSLVTPDSSELYSVLYLVNSASDGYSDKNYFLADLLKIREIINENHQGLFIEYIDRLIFKVQCFGFHFASIDIRQDSRIHQMVFHLLYPLLEEVLLIPATEKSYDQLGAAEQLECLSVVINKLEFLQQSERDNLAIRAEQILKEGVSLDCFQSFKAISLIQKTNGNEAAHRYIISNTQSASDILEVWVLSQIAAYNPKFPNIDIVPLFETIDDLHNSPVIMKELYNLQVYAEHLKVRNNKQHIMVGFSDGTKDGGYVAANWEIYRAKEFLTTVARENGFRVLFFDGRGGPPARGGGNTHKFYRSLGDKIDSTSIQLTIQGQTISSTYGTIASATHNLEQLVSAGIENNIFSDKKPSSTSEKQFIMNRLSNLARNYYLELKAHPQFISYLEEMTPLSYYGKSNISSRPNKRNSSGPLTLDSLRAIPFVGAWSQMKQNIPGFYGFGYALNAIISEGGLEELKRLYLNSLFFRTLVENSMQSLSKTQFQLTKYIGKDPKYGDFWNLLNNEANRTILALQLVSNQKQLLEKDFVNRESIQLRENLILPVVVIQQYALQKLRTITKEDEVIKLEKLILKSLAASINASRNSV